MKKEQLDWQAYRKGLVSSLSNERLWSLGCNSEENFHLENITGLEEEIAAIDRGDFDMILEKHEEFLELFDDYLLPDSNFTTTDSNNPGENR